MFWTFRLRGDVSKRTVRLSRLRTFVGRTQRRFPLRKRAKWYTFVGRLQRRFTLRKRAGLHTLVGRAQRRFILGNEAKLAFETGERRRPIVAWVLWGDLIWEG